MVSGRSAASSTSTMSLRVGVSRCWRPCSSTEMVSCSRVERGALAAIAGECTGTVVGHGRHGTVRGRGRGADRRDASRRRRVLSGRARASRASTSIASARGSTTSRGGARRRRSTACAPISSRLLGFRGNTRDYGDPENSFLDSVLERRLGIPISLAVVMMEVGRRIGAPVHGVGMPGHFLVMDAARDWRVVRSLPRRRALRPRRLPPALRARARQRARLLPRAARTDRSARDRRRACSPTSRAVASRPIRWRWAGCASCT